MRPYVHLGLTTFATDTPVIALAAPRPCSGIHPLSPLLGKLSLNRLVGYSLAHDVTPAMYPRKAIPPRTKVDPKTVTSIALIW